MRSKVISICFWGMVGVVLVYLVASIVPSIFSTQEMTVKAAEAISYDEVLSVRGIALRDEILVTASGTPSSIDYKVSDGDRVSIGDTVAVYSNSDVSASDRLAVENIDRQIELLNESLATTTQYDLNALDARTKDAISLYLTAASENDLSAIREASSDVIAYMIKRDIKASGDKSYYENILENCESSKNSILSGNAKQTAVSASRAGYFSSQFDGYESLRTDEYLTGETDLTPEYINKLLSYSPEARPANYIGKLQHFSFWYFLCTLSAQDVATYGIKAGDSLSLRFDTAAYGSKTVSMSVREISKVTDGKVALTFECSFFDQAIYSLRICDAEIIINSHEGFRVSKDSIRVSDGQNGVYVLSGAKLVFKPVDVLYMSDGSDFAVVAPASEESARKLLLNDSVIVGGKEIKDGKVVNIN